MLSRLLCDEICIAVRSAFISSLLLDAIKKQLDYASPPHCVLLERFEQTTAALVNVTCSFGDAAHFN